MNARIITSVLEGKEQGPKLAAVLMTTAACAYIAGFACSLSEGFGIAKHTINSGRSACFLRSLRATRLRPNTPSVLIEATDPCQTSP